MSQLNFPLSAVRQLPSGITRRGGVLEIPEGIHTIPATHGLHRFPGKFIPNLPRFLIREFLSGGSTQVTDPFCGSGTTVLEAALEGRRFTGIDIDPLAILIAIAKTTPLSESELLTIERHWKLHDYGALSSDHVPNVPRLEHWFDLETITELSSIKAACLELPERTRQFSLAVFSSIIRRVSKADDQTQKTYVSGTLSKEPPLPRSLFPTFLARAIESMRQYVELLPSDVQGTVRVGDARVDVGDNPGHILTSPPYIDSIDYVYNQLLEYFWLLPEFGLKSYAELRKLQKTPMGFRASQVAFGDFASPMREALELSNVDKIAEDLLPISRKESVAVRSFFADYAAHVQLSAQKQRPGAFYICIVGNSTIRGQVVPTSEIVVNLHEAAGYDTVDRLTYEIRRHYMKFPRRNNSGKIKVDHVLVFQRRSA